MMAAAVTAVLGAAGCGGAKKSADPVSQVPNTGGLQDRVRAASAPKVADFPAPKGRTLQALADSIGGGKLEAALASSVFTVGTNRLAFGVIDNQGQFVYGKTGVYVAPSPGVPAQGPFVAPADVLITQPRYRSKQAATEQDPFAAIYAATRSRQAQGRTTRCWSPTAVHGKLVAAPTGRCRSSTQLGRPDPRGRREAAEGPDGHAGLGQGRRGEDRHAPAARRHARRLVRRRRGQEAGRAAVRHAAAVPVAGVRPGRPTSTLQMKSKYGDKMDFIHQEVYVDNDLNKGLRPPLRAFNLRTEPWLFVVGQGRQDHRPSRGIHRRAGLRGRGQDRPVRRAPRGARGGRGRRRLLRWPCRRRVGARARPARSSCRSRSGCSRWAAAAVLVDLVLRAGRAVAAAAAGAGRRGGRCRVRRARASARRVQIVVRARSASRLLVVIVLRRLRRRPGPRWTTGRRPSC